MQNKMIIVLLFLDRYLKRDLQKEFQLNKIIFSTTFI